MLTNVLSTLYLLAGLVGNVAYLPTLYDLWLLKPAANLQSYAIWSGTSFLVFAYAVKVNGNFLFIVLSCQTLCLCSTVVLLELRRRGIRRCTPKSNQPES